MAVEQLGLRKSYPASGDLSTKQYLFAKISSGQIAVCGAGEASFGVLQDTPNAAGVAGSVMYVGISRLVVDGSGTAIAAMDYLKADSSGRGVKTTTSGDEVCAMALEAATTAGAVITVMLVRFRY